MLLFLLSGVWEKRHPLWFEADGDEEFNAESAEYVMNGFGADEIGGEAADMDAEYFAELAYGAEIPDMLEKYPTAEYADEKNSEVTDEEDER